MAFALPNPNTPTNGQLGDATPILANELAIAQAIAAFDGSQINAKSVVEAALADAINPRLRGSETFSNFVYSGCIWSLVSGLGGTMTGGTIYVNGYRTVVTGVGSNTFAASSDTYVDIDYLGNITYNAVSNNAAAPSITANAVRVAKVVTNGSTITSVVQVGADSLGNIIYPAGPGNPVKMQNPYKFSVYRNAAQNSGNGAYVVLQCDTKTFDTGSNVDIVTNKGRFTAPVSGFYQFNAFVSTSVGGAADHNLIIAFFKNGSQISTGQASTTRPGFSGANATILLQLAANDYIEAQVYGDVTLALNVGTVNNNQFSGFLVSAT